MQNDISFSSREGSFSWKHDEFDSKILERNVAKIVLLQYKQKEILQNLVHQLITSFKNHTIVYATYRFDATDFPLIHAFESSGFRLVDISVNLETSLDKKFENLPDTIRSATIQDSASLEELAGNAFSFNRFYNDPLISKKQADSIYSEWIKNSVIHKAADEVFVWEEHKKIYGFTTLKKNGNIVLIAVDRTQRGKGISRYLIKASLNQCVDWGLPEASIETQMTNIPAIRSYQACGFKIIKSLVTFRWNNT